MKYENDIVLILTPYEFSSIKCAISSALSFSARHQPLLENVANIFRQIKPEGEVTTLTDKIKLFELGL